MKVQQNGTAHQAKTTMGDLEAVGSQGNYGTNLTTHGEPPIPCGVEARYDRDEDGARFALPAL